MTNTNSVTEIHCGFLDGNLEDVPPQTYERALRAALEAEFPAAEIVIEHQAGIGSNPYRTRAFAEESEIEIDIHNICERVYEECAKNAN